jgi:hypothetical protein
MESVYDSGGGLVERSGGWKKGLIVMRECEAWLQSE